MVRAYCPVCGHYVGWADSRDEYECGLCRLDYLSNLINSIRFAARMAPKGMVAMFPYGGIFKNDGEDDALMSLELPRAVIRLALAMLSDNVQLHVNGQPVILSNEEKAIIETGLQALSEAV